MKINKAAFITSNTDYKKCPPPDRPEYAFIGRSNVGKSSLINMLTGRNSLAKTSVKPGKTQLINHFIINEEWYLVDLPGYGWAKTSKENKAKWDIMIREYLRERENLLCIFLLIDSRLEPQKIDLEFMEWMANSGIPFVIVFTKADKQSVTKTKSLISAYKSTLLESWEELPQSFITSSAEGLGREEILEFVEKLNKGFTVA
ncbi:MAG: ribosome biogenesis GTP-binding protein YihA/YsxC [Cytophagaceae bacterium]